VHIEQMLVCVNPALMRDFTLMRLMVSFPITSGFALTTGFVLFMRTLLQVAAPAAAGKR
jgi:hypothetical protein